MRLSEADVAAGHMIPHHIPSSRRGGSGGSGIEVYPASQSVPGRQGSLGVVGVGVGMGGGSGGSMAGMGGVGLGAGAGQGGQQQVYQTHIFAPPVTGAPVKKSKYGSVGTVGECLFLSFLSFFLGIFPKFLDFLSTYRRACLRLFLLLFLSGYRTALGLGQNLPFILFVSFLSFLFVSFHFVCPPCVVPWRYCTSPSRCHI